MSREESVSVDSYNVRDFTIATTRPVRLADTLAVRVGDEAPDFDATTLTGRPVRLLGLRGRAHTVLMLGSITSPMAAINLPAMNRLARRYKASVRFVLLYTRESHPGELYTHHTSFAQKLRYAKDFKKAEKVEFNVVVDDLAGTAHRAYGLWPNPLFVVSRDGRVVFRTNLTDPGDLGEFLRTLVASDALANDPDHAPHPIYSERLIHVSVDEATHYRVYTRAGPKSFEDLWKLYPALRDKWPSKRKGARAQRPSIHRRIQKS
jgi:hypothetical protein